MDNAFVHGPSLLHQYAVRNLVVALMKHCPRSLEVLPGPLVLPPFQAQIAQPDVVVVKRASLPAGDGPLATPPVLVAEVIDDDSRAWERQFTPMLYAKNGIEHFWHFDLESSEFVAYRMNGNAAEYKKVVTARNDERVGFDAPVLVEICPARLRFKA
ncbi:Uma2 family endonuclease [Virgisporangium aurantiacum]|uniref:Putative restriction endonuclease domain-containing protein n=1 Tax=Virgisporangium aurantiacum TaxID=175570 RepID=A0A8J4E5A4_9ACTN|nr:Uma2 family endonuclease [Virgisporangium aurantiacum]GIJ61914.1 hypothetical protein Vau01_094300 [Virgisporangium aurantiacum]